MIKTSSPVDRLRQIADEIRTLPQIAEKLGHSDAVCTGGALIDEAIKLGAFAGPEYATLRSLILRAKTAYPDDWYWVVWDETTIHFTKKVMICNSWDKVCPLISDAIKDEAAKVPRDTKAIEVKSYLTDWRAILVALQYKDNRENQRKVRKLNKDYAGPIIIGQKGAQPKVEKAELLEWWNGLERQWQDSQQRQRDAKATVSNQHDFGRTGTVVPDIAGGVQKRRSDWKQDAKRSKT